LAEDAVAVVAAMTTAVADSAVLAEVAPVVAERVAISEPLSQ